MTKEDYIANLAQDAERPFTPLEQEALGLWYDLLFANEYGYIDTNEDDNPFDAPNYISVIVQFLASRDTH